MKPFSNRSPLRATVRTRTAGSTPLSPVLRVGPILSCVALLVLACSSDRGRPKATDGVFKVGGAAGNGGSSGSATGGQAGASGQEQGGAASQSPEVCGNNLIEGNEACDGSDLGGKTCASIGFDEGLLSCVDCSLDTTACTGVERCYDGLDNDGDGDIDCADDDCAALCANACAQPIELPEPFDLQGDTREHADSALTSCATAGGAGDLIFAVRPARSGALEAVLTSAAADLVLAARQSCADAASELACSNRAAGPDGVERIVLPAQQGVTVYLVVDGTGATETGSFQLSVHSRDIVCGDAIVDPGEECDDGGTEPGDGCDSTCKLESSESEPNDTPAQADTFTAPFTRAISSGLDVDVIAVELSHPASNLIVDTFDLGDGACALGLMDPAVDVLAPDGTTVLASDDDSGAGYCAHAALSGLGPGTYFVAVRAAGASPTPFAYRLSVRSDWCGNGVKSDLEECDDGNTAAGDGCGPDCRAE